MLLVQLLMELIDLFASFFKSAAAAGRDAVKPAAAAMCCIQDRFQQTGLFKAVEQRIKGSGADAITVVRELLHHGEAEDGLLRGVEQHMDANQPGEEFTAAIVHRIHYTAARTTCVATPLPSCLLSKFDI